MMFELHLNCIEIAFKCHRMKGRDMICSCASLLRTTTKSDRSVGGAAMRWLPNSFMMLYPQVAQQFKDCTWSTPGTQNTSFEGKREENEERIKS